MKTPQAWPLALCYNVCYDSRIWLQNFDVLRQEIRLRDSWPLSITAGNVMLRWTLSVLRCTTFQCFPFRQEKEIQRLLAFASQLYASCVRTDLLQCFNADVLRQETRDSKIQAYVLRQQTTSGI